MAVDITKNLHGIMLYCETQGDKFRGFGYELAEFLNDDAHSQTVKEARVREVIVLMSDAFPYHANQIQQMLDYDSEY